MIYCNICCEGFNEQFGYSRTVYDYYFEDNKYIEYNRGIKIPDNYDLYDEQENETNQFTSKTTLFNFIKNRCESLSCDNYYYIVYIGCDDNELIIFLNLQKNLNNDIHICRYDKINDYYDYPKKPTISNIKTLTNHKSSNKEDIFIKICKKYITDLEYQVLFTIDNKKYIVDGYSKSTNIIIEFLGDYYHGNPDVYSTDYFNDKLRFKWVENIGSLIIKDASIYIDELKVDTITGEWLVVWNELSMPVKDGYNTMTGNIPEFTNPRKKETTYRIKNNIISEYDYMASDKIKDVNNPSINERYITVPLPFWFSKNHGLSLPIL